MIWIASAPRLLPATRKNKSSLDYHWDSQVFSIISHIHHMGHNKKYRGIWEDNNTKYLEAKKNKIEARSTQRIQRTGISKVSLKTILFNTTNKLSNKLNNIENVSKMKEWKHLNGNSRTKNTITENKNLVDGLNSKLCRAEKKLVSHKLGEKKISWKEKKSKNDIWDTVKYPAYRNLEPQNDRI